MNKRGAGVAFIAIAAVLFSAKYISAVIFGSSTKVWEEYFFNEMLSYIGNPLNVCSIIALIVGLVYIVWGEFEEFINRKSNI